MSGADHDDKLRIDKWLWAARFFKTRSLAADAVEGGKALVNGQRVKPAKALKPGDELFVRTQGADYTVLVRALSDRRGPASEAARLYEETAESMRKREEVRLTRTPRESGAFIRGRPTKRARRQLQKLRDDTL
jgi:ribosome-associated heat shock protein Hsp15